MNKAISSISQFPVALLAALLATSSHAFEPTIQVVEPNGTQYVAGFPALVNVGLSISVFNPQGRCLTNAIKSLSVDAQHTDDSEPTTIHASLQNPINNDPVLCPAPYNFQWSVPKPGSYNLVVTATHGNDDGTTSTVVEFLMLAVEFPAPPAVANAYINGTPDYKSASGKKRGCVISKIAENHAKDSKYGPKGGPYNEPAVISDVNEYYSNGSCPAK
ncbi:hypothetical protein NNO07_15015 [Pseudomonas resinovorans]|uniref:Uncharacterized protein n=1 Tax=Metapseudomonas resinovorans TaxID=53412 RepID=A0ABT4Y6A4_METRE|nr:hypothetical protein [Pseudomonas resinovorans]MDA8484384.1 hypothetical protein [Pseudomonas resinovorans]